MSKSPFNDWFVSQYGRRPGGLVTNNSLVGKVQVGRRADLVLRNRQLYDEQKQAALRSWMARGNTKANP